MAEPTASLPEIESNGDVRLDYAFQLHARYEAPLVSRTPKGDFRYQDIRSGEVRGRRLNATVYANSGGQYDTVRPDGVRDADAHFILAADNGEHIYVEHFGHRRPDGYHRLVAYLDADVKGAYDWVNDTTFVVTVEESADQRTVVFTYYAAN